jgi:pimeloyl-ACP methyl ester carboxylesterase
MRVAVIFLSAAVGALLVATSAGAEPAFCSPGERACARVFVPLDRTGAVPGTIGIQVERRRVRRPVRPPLFLIAGGPGQSSTRAFGQESVDDLLGGERRARDVYVIDPRGTGSSGLLRCDKLQRAGILSVGSAAADCATRLGARRAFYTARDSADDLEAVRREIGAPKIAVLGISYGTKVALAYARRYPTHVDRLVLDSVLDAESTPDPLYRPSFAAVPRVLRSLCRGGSCRASTRHPVQDLTRLAARAERRPVRGRVVDGRGRGQPAELTGASLFTLMQAGDLDPAVRAAFPGLVRNALKGDPAPILRAAAGAAFAEGSTDPPEFFSAAAYVAAICEESPLPWARTAPFADRRRQAREYALAQPTSAFAPFGRVSALTSDILDTCLQWPTAATPPTIGGRPPDVPALLMEGESDLRTPVENARAVAARMPRARVLVVPDTGHDAVDSDQTGCAPAAMRRFLAGGTPPATCQRRPRKVLPKTPPPLSLRELAATGRTHGRRGRTVKAIDATVDDITDQLTPLVLSSLIDTFGGDSSGGPIRAGGLRGGSGTYVLEKDVLILRRVSFVPGVRISGRLRSVVLDDASKGKGTLRVSGGGTARGTLRLRGRTVTGRLGGRRVRDRVSFGLDPKALVAQTARAGGPIRPPIR